MRGREPPADVTLRLDALAGRGDADGAAIARIRRAASQYRRRLNTKDPAVGDPAPAARCRLPGPHRPTPGRGGVIPPVRRWRRQTPRCRPVGPRQPPGRRRNRPESLRPHPPGSPAGPGRHPGRPHHRDGRKRFRPGLRRGAVPPSPAGLGALVLDDRTIPADPAETATALAAAFATRLATLDWTEAARQFQARAACLRQIDETIPELSDAALAASVQDWLAPHLTGLAKLSDATKLDLVALLRARLGWEAASRLDRDLPTHLTLPHGRAAIDYTQPVPLAAARAQIFYGQRTTPLLCAGRVKLQFALLSPAGRPVAITADLAGFWGGAWADVRRDMRGRYPRHDWPENPGTGSP